MFGKTELETLKNELEVVKSNHNKLLGAIEFIGEERFELCKEIIEFSKKVENLFEMSTSDKCQLSDDARTDIAVMAYDLKESKNNFNNVIVSVIEDYNIDPRSADGIKIFDGVIATGVSQLASTGVVEAIKKAVATFGVTASGARIADLHGAAKITASLASIGGGSVASGGGGMAAGISRLTAIGTGVGIVTMLVVPLLIEWNNNKNSSREIRHVINELTKANDGLIVAKEEFRKELKLNTRCMRRVREMFMELDHALKTNNQEELSKINIDELFVPLQKLTAYVNNGINI